MHVRIALAGRLTALAALPLFAATAHAVSFKLGSLAGNFDTTSSAGATLRMEDPDPTRIAIVNGGAARTANEDDGDLNYGKGDVISAVAKATHDLEMGKEAFGAFVRATYFTDFRNDGPVETSGARYFGPQAQDRLHQEFTLLDAYLRGTLRFGDVPLNIRLGNQVVNWGESTFIGNSVNVINPIDVAKIRAPGAEVKEALIPSPMVWFSIGATEALTAEAVWIAHFDKTLIDPRGSFFSTNDFISDDGDNVYAGFGRRKDQHAAFTSPAADPAAQVWVPRAPTPEVRDQRKQHGLALRYFMEGLGNTEVGLFYLKYHSRTPLVSAVRGTTTSLANVGTGGGTARYFDEFPSNIDVYGTSFNTGGPFGVALQGEYSYRPNQPTQLAAIEVLLAALGLPNNITGAGAAAVPAGTVIEGYRRVKLHQAQLTATKAFGPTLGAAQFVLLGEAGVNHQELPDGLLFNAPGAALPAPGSAAAAGGDAFQTEGFASQSSWGSRLLSRMDFENVVGPMQASPRLVLSHDVHGVGPNFNQDAAAVSAGLTFNYLQTWQADLAYTAFFGGRVYRGTQTSGVPPGQAADYATHANPNVDRDFLAVSVSYSF